MNRFLLFMLCPFFLIGQVQIGQDIDGELTIAGDNSGRVLSMSSDGSIVAIGATGNDGNGTSSGHVRIYRNVSDVWTQIGSDIDGEAAGDSSGFSVSLSSDGGIVAVGASSNDGNGERSGHVRIYRNISDVWTQIGSDIDGEAAGDSSGFSVSLSSDGGIVAVGASSNDGNGERSGHVRIYRNISDVWTQIGSDIDGESIDDLSGVSVSLSSDGSIVVIGASSNDGNGTSSGHVRIYRNVSDVWTQIGSDIDGEAAFDNSGTSVSISSDGNIVAIGALRNDGNGVDSGHVRIYRNVSDTWTQIGNDIEGEAAGDNSGTSVSISSDGNIVAIGATGNDGNGVDSGHVRIYRNVSDVWTQVGSDIEGEAAGDNSGTSVSISSDGNIVAIGALRNDGNGDNSGHARIYINISDTWIQVGTDIDGGEPIGGSSGVKISISSDGNIVAIGATANNGNGERSGHVRIYENVSGVWTQIGDDIDGEAAFDRSGSSVSLSSDGNIVAVGAVFNDGNGNASGHVRIYENVSGTWTQIGDDIDGEATGDLSGHSVGLSSDGNIVAIGATQNDGNGSSSGHVRIYENVSGVWTQIGDDIDGEAADDRSGSRLSLSSDGNIVAISGDFNDGNGEASGHVRIYENVLGIWTQIGDDIDGEASGDRFGLGLSLSSNGNIIAIGTGENDGNGEASGHVRIYENVSGIWTQIGDDIDGETAGDFLGRSVSLSSDGSIIAIGVPGNDENGPDSGHVKIYRNISGVWTQVGTTINGEATGDLSGQSVGLSSDGRVIAIGAPGNAKNSGHVRVYDLSAVLSTKSFERDYFSYHPNPVTDILNIELKQDIKLKKVNIYNLQSQYLYSVKTSKIDVSNLSSGMYFIEVETNQGKSAKKIIID
ncbi:T9SS type A sorting domain-containing protein [uncultured Algibacter sp.]|uniref:T9SS type A sorting domain-containing protein n=1 Tax=uncultured Algibacter sp. TaxID=298659 RepID=UPI0026383E42|nr:T9SS type A sorting domain-containing protein [uncultured Algibacter sp.]